jgi:hypothetical protein
MRSSRPESLLSAPAKEPLKREAIQRIPKLPLETPRVAPGTTDASVSTTIPAPVLPAMKSSAEEIEARRRIEESFLDLRVALILHDKALGEKAYPILRGRSDLAVERARVCLRNAQDSFEREVATKALALLTAPPTHGLLRHFQW